MVGLCVFDVGDGLAVHVNTIDRGGIQIDCGSQNRSDQAFKKSYDFGLPETFILSHFHADHYNGLLQWTRAQHNGLRIRRVFFPRIPCFEQRSDFVRCALAMNRRIIGGVTGSMTADFLGIVFNVSDFMFTYKALSKGETANVESSRFDVLWPPRVLETGSILNKVGAAIRAFNKAKDKDPRLREIYETIGDEGMMNRYLRDDEGNSYDLHGYTRREHQTREPLFQIPEEDLPPLTKDANKELRKVANHLSLAFYEDNRLLFMGDLEKHEIVKVVRDLVPPSEKRFFYVLIAPHHGTHWHDDLKRIRAQYSISSFGQNLLRNAYSDFKHMSNRCLTTHFQGDVRLSVCSTGWYRPPLTP